ncbi:MAG TPA: ABC transporter permease [Candidatus Prevotella avicola]|uniref:Transport permease protein n=1 Tax=Candidatus Prevotella avicola TaxID=2838738 RepID=A0A9D2FZR5_9BACT|nr:ABC transporter permease [Candidatus Prevotella avicola]
MSVFQSLVKKEALHLLRDFRTIIVVLVMPVVLLLLFGFAISTEVNNVRVATVVEQHTDQTKQIIDRFRTNPYFTFEGVVAYSDVEDLLRKGKVDATVVFRTRDGKLEHQVIVDASNTIMAQTATAYLESVISPGADTPIVASTLYNPRLRSAYNFVPGIMGMIFILICAMMTSVSIVREKETGTMDLLLVSPVRPWTIVFGKLVPYFLLSCVILAFTLVLSYTVLGIPFSFRLFDVIWVTILYVILALALGLLISTIASTQVAALLISGVMFMIPVILLSGMIFPVENMPLVLQWISCVIPARWYISAMRVLMIQRLPVGYVLTEVLVLAGMTLLVLALAIKKFNAKK